MARLNISSTSSGGRPSSSHWKRELQRSVRTLAELEAVLDLTPDERAACLQLERNGGLPLTLTPAMIRLIEPSDPNDPIRRQLIPRSAEFDDDIFQIRDPLGEEDHTVVPRLVHRYPDRVLLLVTDRCAAYCRFCTRKRIVGQGPPTTRDNIDDALGYIASHEEVREVIVSGGDVLLLDDERLDALLSRLRSIPHVDIIRLATRMLAFAPSRVTPALSDILERHHPVYILSHFNHPREISPEAADAILALTGKGVPVLNQTVLLRGVNDDAAVLATLFRRLTSLRARPYYLHQCDVAHGTAQFRVPIDEAKNLMAKLRGNVSGLSIPTLVIDVPGGKGKVPIYPDPVVSTSDDAITLRGSLGKIGTYPRK